MLERSVLFCAIGHARDQTAHLVDDFGLVRPIRGMRLGVRGSKLQGRRQRVFNLAAKTLR